MGNGLPGIKKRVWKESLINYILVLWLESEENCYGSIMCLEVWKLWSQSCFILHLSLPLFPVYVWFGNQQTFGLKFWTAVCCKKHKKKIRAETCWHVAWKSNDRHGSWNEDLQKKEQLLAARNVKKPVSEGGIRLVDLPVGLEVSQNLDYFWHLQLGEKQFHLKYFCI